MSDCPRTAAKYHRYIQMFMWRLYLPMSIEKLCQFQIGHLRQIASMFKSYNGAEMKDFSREDLIRFIGGHQHTPEQYKPIQRIKGLVYPDCEDQHFRAIFDSKRDYWQRP